MANKNGEFKRRYPRLGKCVCCFCLSPHTSIIVCTILILIYFILTIASYVATLFFAANVGLIDNIFNNIPLLIDGTVYLVLCGSLILLLIGLKNVKSLYFMPFKVFFLLYIIYILIGGVYSFIVSNDDEYIKTQIQAAKESYEKYNQPFNEEIYVSTIKTTLKITLVIRIVEACVLFYYYLTTCSYVEDLEEDVAKDDELRNMEDNAY